MHKILLFTIGIVCLAVVLLCIRILIKKGKFPNTHIGDSQAMRSRGIKCATSQDREAQQRAKYCIQTKNL